MRCIIFLTAISAVWTLTAQQLPTMHYTVDVTTNTDTFYVSLNVKKPLEKAASVFQFAATAPGTYQTMNIGRYVSNFKVFDQNGKRLEVAHPSVNQFMIAQPQKVAQVTYSVAETFDTRVEEFPIYLMCGSSIEADHAMINPHTILGYFDGYQQSPLSIQVKGKELWQIGTAMKYTDGRFQAEDFDQAVDSPILIGDLSRADTVIDETQVEIFAYSSQGKIQADELLKGMSDMLDASRKFLVKLPVDRYTFLYFFEPNPPGTPGAWEHSYSSGYVINEKEPTPGYMEKVTDIASHEFFHIVTPLNIHSEVVEQFDFVTPTPSVHLWLYEGVTEWASNILLYRGGVVEEEEYLKSSLARKVYVAENYYDSTWSLKKLSDESFKGGDGARQYSNIYYKGALVAALLDIRLLELSDGKYGLRELVLDLIDKYGKGNPVSEESFFDDLAAMTYPEIGDYFDQYVLNADPLPYEAYFAKIGLAFERAKSGKVSLTRMDDMSMQQQKLYKAWSMNMER